MKIDPFIDIAPYEPFNAKTTIISTVILEPQLSILGVQTVC